MGSVFSLFLVEIPNPSFFIYHTMRIYSFFLLLLLSFLYNTQAMSQNQVWDPELNQFVAKKTDVNRRTLRYTPDGDDFVIRNGKTKFNRALYGTNSGFRVETSDVPEFALYLPRMGGNLTFSVKYQGKTLALNDAKNIESRYRAGSRIYTISDPLLQSGKLLITALAMGDAEGMILKIETKDIAKGTQLHWTFGGAADKRFSREGDLGVDPADCFSLKPEYCKGNQYKISKNCFQLQFGAKLDKKLTGIFPTQSKLNVTSGEAPVVEGSLALKTSNIIYLAIKVPTDSLQPNYRQLATVFAQAENARKKVASQITINTPDAYLNTLGGVISTAADGIWSGETWLHGAVGWRMPLSGWRAAYAGDALGWHNRARRHFDAYADSQVKDVTPTLPHPAQDSALNLARAAKVWGTPMYSNGYICRNPHENNKMHHYDMNLCYIDELLWHLKWTGDLDYARKIWPTIASSLAWEKRNFDPDNDGLYDAYCCIWASDGLYYNSGAVTHSSAYNYRANKVAAEIASKIGIDPQPYQTEAERILKAMNSRLWLNGKGHWAEFQDFMGEKKTHESAALWTIYHAIDSETQDAFQGYQATRYVDNEIPHIPVQADGLKDDGYYTLSSSNWMPYCWSTNNVVTAEVLHTALAYWEAGRNEEASKIFKSTILDAMYLGSSPGNVSQISFYDAARGECYRDFGDPIGVLSRALVQGMFGIMPDALNNQLTLQPGFPKSWDHAAISTPDLHFQFQRQGNKETYLLEQHFSKPLSTELKVKIYRDQISSVLVDGKAVAWKNTENAGDFPVIAIPVGMGKKVEIQFEGNEIEGIANEIKTAKGQNLTLSFSGEVSKTFDPQSVISKAAIGNHQIVGTVSGAEGHRTLFALKKQGQMQWWQPIHIAIEKNKEQQAGYFEEVKTINCEPVNIDAQFNDSVNRIFEHRYLSPRSPYTTLQIPTQGIGEWCHPTQTAKIDDSGLRKLVQNNQFTTSLGVPFRTLATGKNVAFTSLWDNFPRKTTVQLTGKASHAYLLLAGSTNQMQSRFVNGRIVALYTDGSNDTLNLVNPDNWCPIEQDYYVDGKAFAIDAPRPYRLHLKTGLVSNNLGRDLKIEGVYGRKIEGGAGVLLDMKLNPGKTLKALEVETTANEVIIGLMALTLQR